MRRSTLRTNATWVFLASFVMPWRLSLHGQRPVNGTWSTAAALPQPMQELSATVLHGRIYVAGGIDRTNRPSAAAYRYDPTTDRWERIADLPAPRHHMPLAAVGDTLYAVGGLSERSFVPESTLWLYREDANRWEARAPLPVPRGASAAAAAGGKLIVVGGWGGGGGRRRRRGPSTPPDRRDGDLRPGRQPLARRGTDPHAA